MSDSTTTKVGKLLRVLVAGGVALAGAPALASDKGADDKAAAEKAKEKEKKEKAEKEKKAKDAKDGGGGVKGW